MEKQKINSFRDLIVWQKSMALVTDIYRMAQNFPENEACGLTQQIRRCAVSVPSNIAEGYGRNSTNDYLRFLRIAVGSLYEMETQTEIAKNLGYIKSDMFIRISETICEIERMLCSLSKKIEKH